jgi:hypothetical protein
MLETYISKLNARAEAFRRARKTAQYEEQLEKRRIDRERLGRRKSQLK